MKVLTAGMNTKPVPSLAGDGKGKNSRKHRQPQLQQHHAGAGADAEFGISSLSSSTTSCGGSTVTDAASMALDVESSNVNAKRQHSSNRNDVGPETNDNDADTTNSTLQQLRIGAQQLETNQASTSTKQVDDLYYTSAPPPVIQNTVELLVAEETKKYAQQKGSKSTEFLWLAICFFGIMGSFVAYGLLLEYATSGGKQLHELSFLFITSLLYTMTASVGRYARAETPSTIPPAQFAVLGLTSMGSTFFSVRALRYVIYPIQVLAKSCKPVPVMLMGALMGKKYPMKKYLKVALIVAGVGLFMGGGDKKKKSSSNETDEKDASSQLIGVTLLFISLCFDGGTGAYEDKLMSVHSVGPFDLMYNIQLGKTILAGIGLIILNQVHIFAQMCQDMGFLLVALGLSGAIGQVFIFVTIAKFGALTCAIIGLARKVATLVASIYFYGHALNRVQTVGLIISIGAMVNDFFSKKDKKGGHGHGHVEEQKHGDEFKDSSIEETRPMLLAAPAVELEMGHAVNKR